MAAPTRSAPLRVLSIPDDRSYVERCRPADVVAIRVAPEAAFDPAWLAAHRGEFDVVHLHFGFEQLSPDELRAWIAALAEHRVPLVFTLHGLRNPNHDRPEAHDALLDLLLPAATTVITLTGSAAATIQRRWNRTASVVAHPPVADLDDLPTRRPTHRRVGIHLKDLRRNIVEPTRLVTAAARGAVDAGGRLQVDVHPEVLDRPELAGIRTLAAAGTIDLHPHPRFSDRELIHYLAGLDVSVLPYRFGTHSGRLEACRDVGTRVVAPTCGFYLDQWSGVVTYRADERIGLDERSLADAVRDALLLPAPVTTTEDRRHQAEQIRDAHARIYAGLDTGDWAAA
jgi:hypothetical protein